jgi:hypothetical protein
MQKGVQLFLWWAIMQGIAMHLQNRYQHQRLQTRIALGKVGLVLIQESNNMSWDNGHASQDSRT